MDFYLLCPFLRQFGEGETKISCGFSLCAGLGKQLPGSSAPTATAAADVAMGHLSSRLFSGAGGIRSPHPQTRQVEGAEPCTTRSEKPAEDSGAGRAAGLSVTNPAF